MLRKCVAKSGIPFATTQMGKGVIDERDPLFLGNTALSANPPKLRDSDYNVFLAVVVRESEFFTALTLLPWNP